MNRADLVLLRLRLTNADLIQLQFNLRARIKRGNNALIQRFR